MSKWKIVGGLWCERRVEFYLTVLPMHLESSYHWPQSQFWNRSHLFRFKAEKTVNNNAKMKNCVRIMVREERGVLLDRPAYAFRIKLSLTTKSVLKYITWIEILSRIKQSTTTSTGKIVGGLWCERRVEFYLSVLPMHLESNYHWPQSQFWNRSPGLRF